MSLRKLLGKRKHIEYKYNLNHWLLQQSQAKREYTIRTLSTLCGVSTKTFNGWRYIKQNQSAEVAHSAVVKICRFMRKDINNFQTEVFIDTENKIIKK